MRIEIQAAPVKRDVVSLQLLYCPCHESKFEPKDGDQVVDGPVPRMLPALPLKLIEGKMAVAKPFTAPVALEVHNVFADRGT